METFQISIVALLVVILVVYRQMRTRPAAGMSSLYIAGAMMVLGIISGGLIDTAQPALSIALFIVEAAAAVALGVWRARTVHLWVDAAGATWAKGTGWTLVAWLTAAAIRVGFYFAGTAAGLTISTGSILVFFGLTIGTQTYLVTRRGRALTDNRILSSGDA